MAIYLYKAQNETKKIKPVSDMPVTSNDLLVVQTAKIHKHCGKNEHNEVHSLLFQIEEKQYLT